MTQIPTSSIRFAYEAQTSAGHPISGTIIAPAIEVARHDLAQMQLLVVSLGPQDAPSGKPLTADDFAAFNQQLATLTAAGLPVEQGLRLVALEVSSGRLGAAIRSVLADLDAGQTLPQALERQGGQFPPAYARLVDAGIRMNNLPAMLFNMSRHVELVKRMRGAIWRALAYPLMVAIGLLLVMVFLSYKILPAFAEIFKDFRTTLPTLTEWVLFAGRFFPPIGLVLIILLVAWPLVWIFLQTMHWDQVITDSLLLDIPLVGPVLRRNLTARWCDSLRLAVEGGLDLPRALQITADALNSPAIAADTGHMLALINAGQQLDQFKGGRILPASIGSVLHLASARHDLAGALASLTVMYQEQAEDRVTLLPAILSPIFIGILALVLGTVITAMFLPLVRLIQSVSGGS